MSRRPHASLYLVVIVMAGVLASTGCTGSNGKSNSTATVRSTLGPSTAGPTPTPGPIALQIVSPAEGGKVSNPFTLSAQANGIQIEPWSLDVPGAAHFDAFLDKAPVAEGKVVPSGSGIFHFTAPITNMRVASGQHTITVILSDDAHVRIRGAPTAEVTFTVGQ